MPAAAGFISRHSLASIRSAAIWRPRCWCPFRASSAVSNRPARVRRRGTLAPWCCRADAEARSIITSDIVLARSRVHRSWGPHAPRALLTLASSGLRRRLLHRAFGPRHYAPYADMLWWHFAPRTRGRAALRRRPTTRAIPAAPSPLTARPASTWSANLSRGATRTFHEYRVVGHGSKSQFHHDVAGFLTPQLSRAF